MTQFPVSTPNEQSIYAALEPKSPPAQQQQQDETNRDLAARSGNGIHLNFAAKLSNNVGPAQFGHLSSPFV